MTPLAASVVPVSIILGVALALVAALRRRSAALRHWVLAAAVVGAFVSPMAPLISSAWRASWQQRWTIEVVERGVLARHETRVEGDEAFPARAQRWIATVRDTVDRQFVAATELLRRVHARLPFMIVFVWALGTFLLLARLCGQLWHLHRYSRRLDRIDEHALLAQAAETARRLCIRRRIVFLEHPDPAMVVTWGTWTPRVLLPVDARRWSAERIRIVLAHEFAHIRRRDWSIQIGAAVLQAIYWFNPLAWLTAAALRRESERACDDLVLAIGIAPPDYAAHLVDLARAAAVRRMHSSAAAAVAQPSTLEGRVRAMLNARLDRTPLTGLVRSASGVIVLAVVLAAVALSPAASAQAGFGSISAVVYDQSGGLLPGVTVAAKHVESGRTFQQTTDGTGRFALTNVPSGTWDISTSFIGFATVRNTIDLQPGDFLQRNLVLPLGSLEETITIVGPAEPGVAVAPPAPRQRQVRDLPVPRAASSDSRGIGGNIRVPHMLVKVNPIFPAELGGTAAVVTIAGRIGIDGYLVDLKDVSETPAPAAFVNALLTAVRQWEYTPTLLNGSPVEANITITGRFTSR